MPIVCGTDFSESADRGLTVAVAFARRWREPLTLVHATTASDPTDARLAELVERIGDIGVAVQPHRLTGSPDEAIVEYAQQVQARLVVVSSLGQRVGSRWLLGSTAERIARTSAVPVLVVRSADPFEAWARGERPLRIVLGFDFCATSDAAVRWLDELRAIGPCDVFVAHIYRPRDEHRRLGIPDAISAPVSPEVERLLEHNVAARVGEIPGEGRVEIRIHAGTGDVADALVARAEVEGVDLLVVGTYQRSGLSRLWHRSVTLGVLCGAPMGVACVPAPARAERLLAGPLPQIARVLVPTDFSELGDYAIPYAYALPRPGGTVHLLHVIETRSLPNPLYAHYTPGRAPTPQEQEKQRDELIARLQALVPRQAAARGIATEVEIVDGDDPSEAICAAAERLGADAICLCSHGRTGIMRALGGSVTQGVMTRTHRPLFVVRPPRD